MGEHESHSHTIHWARRYDLMVTLLSLGRGGRFREEVIERAGIEPGHRVLDVGCGPGRLALDIAEVVGAEGRVCGIDAAEEMVALAASKAAKAGLEVDFQVASAGELPFEEASFDRVVSTLVYHHLPDDVLEASLREIRRVLVPGGRVVIFDFEPGSGPPVHRALGGLFRLFGHHHAHGHSHARPLVEWMGEVGLVEPVLEPSARAHVEVSEASRSLAQR